MVSGVILPEVMPLAGRKGFHPTGMPRFVHTAWMDCLPWNGRIKEVAFWETIPGDNATVRV